MAARGDMQQRRSRGESEVMLWPDEMGRNRGECNFAQEDLDALAVVRAAYGSHATPGPWLDTYDRIGDLMRRIEANLQLANPKCACGHHMIGTHSDETGECLVSGCGCPGGGQ